MSIRSHQHVVASESTRSNVASASLAARAELGSPVSLLDATVLLSLSLPLL